jgi:glycosyltransferase involved in cell wall biosynthesis
MHIAHLTSVHHRHDSRIYHKMCKSIAKTGHTVSLIVSDNRNNERVGGVSIYGIPLPSKSRIYRILNAPALIYKKAILIDADLYQIHDPELIPIGLKLVKSGKKVVFDSHEDYSKQITTKKYFFKPLLHIIAFLYKRYEAYACRRFHGIIAATGHIANKLSKYNKLTIDVYNFPIINELYCKVNWPNKSKEACYVGALAVNRGVREMVIAGKYVNKGIRINIGGSFGDKNIENEVKKYSGWSNVNELGYLNREEVRDVLSRSVVGLVMLHPLDNYVNGHPVKMYEYMAAGIPVIASDFPLYRSILVDGNCGICVNYDNPEDIAKAINFLIDNPKIACDMGSAGRHLVQQKYNWNVQELKLLNFYNKIIGS